MNPTLSITGRERILKMARTAGLEPWLAGGMLEFPGRTDFQVKVCGFRIEPGVRERAVLVRQDAGETRFYHVRIRGRAAGRIQPRSRSLR